MKAVLSSEILKPKGGRELLESWGIEVNTMSRSGRKAWDSLALELQWLSESSQLAIVSARRCWKKFARTCYRCGSSCVVWHHLHLQQVFSFIAATIFPLEEIRYTKRMNVAQRKKTVAWRDVFDHDRECSLTCYVETLHGIIILCLALLHAVVPSRGDLQPASDKS